MGLTSVMSIHNTQVWRRKPVMAGSSQMLNFLQLNCLCSTECKWQLASGLQYDAVRKLRTLLSVFWTEFPVACKPVWLVNTAKKLERNTKRKKRTSKSPKFSNFWRMSSFLFSLSTAHWVLNMMNGDTGQLEKKNYLLYILGWRFQKEINGRGPGSLNLLYEVVLKSNASIFS
jgi:hypothetical protein